MKSTTIWSALQHDTRIMMLLILYALVTHVNMIWCSHVFLCSLCFPFFTLLFGALIIFSDGLSYQFRLSSSCSLVSFIFSYLSFLSQFQGSSHWQKRMIEKNYENPLWIPLFFRWKSWWQASSDEHRCDLNINFWISPGLGCVPRTWLHLCCFMWNCSKSPLKLNKNVIAFKN